KQIQVDSNVALTPAALKRRQEREKLEDEVSSSAESQDRLAKARKGVASVMLKCVPSTLGDVVRQLCKSSEYSCYLVGGNEEVRKSKFHVVSFLDDYVNRPKLLSNVNLYGFMMRCFRKRKRPSCAI
ncbi:hypothetical protein JG687_00008294, partial [Phytophthora cactorum]